MCKSKLLTFFVLAASVAGLNTVNGLEIETNSLPAPLSVIEAALNSGASGDTRDQML